jgi:hypothetical protein
MPTLLSVGLALNVLGDSGAEASLGARGLGTQLHGAAASLHSDLEGTTISALGLLNPANAGDALAIGALTVGGNVANSRILAGYDRAGAAANADASIGSVFVRGDWHASDLAAGIAAGPDGFFGSEDDELFPGGTSLLASIASVVIKGNRHRYGRRR